MKRIIRPVIVLAALALILALPYRIFIGPIDLSALFGGGTDAVSSASLILDAPSGEYVALLNADRHDARGTTDQWIEFLNGESLVIMDDVTCMVADIDVAGMTMAESYRSRLPENQMRLSAQNAELMLSKAECGMFDIIVMSREFADMYSAQTVYGLDNVRVVERSDADETADTDALGGVIDAAG